MAPKKPTQAQIIQGLLAQVAELRGRVEKLEQQSSVKVVQVQPPDERAWWSWR